MIVAKLLRKQVEMDLNAMIKTVCIDAIPLVLALVLHEIMHGYMALKNGDPTAKLAGRLTLNPLDHISPVSYTHLTLPTTPYV